MPPQSGIRHTPNNLKNNQKIAMLMRKLLLTLAVVSLVAISCTDKEYDLSNLESDFAIGDAESEFLAPLAVMSFHAESFTHHSGSGTESIVDVYQEADIWLPTQLPNGADYVEVERLMHDHAYLDVIVKALIAEMESSSKKANEVFELIATKHKTEYLSCVRGHITDAEYAALESATTEQAVAVIRTLFEADHSYAVDAVETICEGRLNDLTFDDVAYDIPAIDVSDDVKKMIIGNIGDKSNPSATEKLFIAGHVDSGFPFDIKISPKVVGTSIEFNNIALAFGKESDIPEKRIYANDVEQLFNGSKAVISFSIERYYPGRVDILQQEAHIELHLRKVGSLTL